jgi:hypothetical protein
MNKIYIDIEKIKKIDKKIMLRLEKINPVLENIL